MEIFTLINLFTFSWFVTNHSYLQTYIDGYWEDYDASYETVSHLIKKVIVNVFMEVLSCHKCLAFWSTLLWTWNLPSALLVSFTAYVFQKIMDRF
jgi:hypothetical protein